MSPKILPGRADPLGATPSADGTNFAVASAGDQVTLCLFDPNGVETRLVLPERDGDTRHGFVPGVTSGQAYGFRVSGPYDPARGLRYNPTKLLLDPYARAIHGQVRFGPEVLGHASDDPGAPSPLDSAAHVPRSLVISAPPPAVPGPGHALADTIIYELHVHGFTATHPGVPADLRGTYAGLAHPAALQHLIDLGVTAVELLPVHHNVPESFLIERGLTNYWGYNTIGFFAPQAKDSCGWCGPANPAVRSLSSAPWSCLWGGAGGCDRCGVQPHGRRRRSRWSERWPRRPRALQRRLLPARPGRRGPLRRHHGVRQFAERRPSHDAADDHEFTALLVRRDGCRRFRFDLEPTLGRQEATSTRSPHFSIWWANIR